MGNTKEVQICGITALEEVGNYAFPILLEVDFLSVCQRYMDVVSTGPCFYCSAEISVELIGHC